ncbi:PspA/IM30 family protein [Agrobacterium genomosp. 3]|uniref:PspA/IM30 family protein n=1 Tax=Agrobacterium tomkonis TaxID=1183410 RepID=UPI001B75625A|nr:PspA/IM30 family protein [Agrobacterium sp.]MCA1865604.1 PspA/IM30 family protein [Agrobacterium tomkonis]MCA1875956.1 PspA/IM30 family protein [Agrobacterium tumefaciens]MCA1891821.1 PspA/IM30 family protein [Agrobacterium tomkonis]
MSTKLLSNVVLALNLSREDRSSLEETLLAYRRAMAILDQTEGANLVALHAAAYEEIRVKTGLPSRMVTLALRDHSQRDPQEPVRDIPLDSKLFSVKGPDSLSIATLSGRVVVPYTVLGYHDGWNDFSEARLVFEGETISIHAGIKTGFQPNREASMNNEGILGRLGRVIAGVMNNAVDAAEASNPVAVAQQAVREIAKIAEEARAALGVAVAAGHRLKSKAVDLDEEISDLDDKIRIGLENGREDLARAATGLQIDLEAQREALNKAIIENAAEIAEAETTLRSIASAKADAQKRLEDAKRAERAAPASVDATPSQRNDRRLAEALEAIERVTGTPAKPNTGAAEVEELGRMQRQSAIEARLKAFREGER